MTHSRLRRIAGVALVAASFAADRADSLEFPRDHGAHPEAAVEW